MFHHIKNNLEKELFKISDMPKSKHTVIRRKRINEEINTKNKSIVEIKAKIKVLKALTER